MKKGFLIAIILATVILAAGCAQPKPVPPAGISEILALSEAVETKDYVEVQAASDRGEYFYVMIYIQPVSGEFTTLEDAIPQAKKYTMEFAEAAVKILSKYEIDKTLTVWAQLPLAEGGVTILGHSEYDGETFLDFETYTP
ncbi:hypothetical protein ACFLUG_00980 [Chloroflexota bacterium]